MKPGDEPVLTTKRLPINGVETEIQGWAMISKPFPLPSILVFCPDGPESPDLPGLDGRSERHGLGCPSAVPGIPAAHYGWVLRVNDPSLDVSLDFTYADRALNESSLARVPKPPPFDDGHVRIVCKLADFRNGWTGYRYPLEYQGTSVPAGFEPLAARVMEHLISETIDHI